MEYEIDKGLIDNDLAKEIGPIPEGAERQSTLFCIQREPADTPTDPYGDPISWDAILMWNWERLRWRSVDVEPDPEYIEVDTFKPLGGEYFRYRNHVFFGDEGQIEQANDYEDIDFETTVVTVLGPKHIRINDDVFCGDVLIEGANANTFEIVGGELAQDDQRVYQGWDVVAGITPPVTHLRDDYFRSGSKVFYEFEPIRKADAKSFRAITDCVAVDKSAIYLGKERFTRPKIDADSFEWITADYPTGWCRDKKGIYYIGSPFSKKAKPFFEVDTPGPQEFKGVDVQIAEDDQFIYWEHLAFEKSSMTYFGEGLARIKGQLFYEMRELKTPIGISSALRELKSRYCEIPQKQDLITELEDALEKLTGKRKLETLESLDYMQQELNQAADDALANLPGPVRWFVERRINKKKSES